MEAVALAVNTTSKCSGEALRKLRMRRRTEEIMADVEVEEGEAECGFE